MVKEADLSDDTRKLYLEFLQDTLHKAYLEMLEKDITKAFVFSFKGQAETLFQNYLDHAEAYVTKSKVKDPTTKDEMQPDEGFLKSIEEQIAIIGPAADGFRQEVIAYLWAATRRGEKIDYESYEPLKEAIREEADELGPRHQPDHHQGPNTGRGAATEVRFDGGKPDWSGLYRGQHRHHPQICGQPPLEGLRTEPLGATF
jgi:hypothetical protein